jgi:hypothetical protein
MAHFADEDGHSWALVAKVEIKLHLIALRIERVDVLLYFIAWNKETVKFPFYAHEKHAVLTVYVLVKVDDVTLVVGNKFCYFRNDSLLVRTMQK